MDNAQKAIMVGVGLFITIIIISAVMLITSAGQDLMDQSMGELGDISQNLSAQLTAKYDGTVLTGSEVVAAVKSLYTKQGLAVAVDNGEELINYGKKYCGGIPIVVNDFYPTVPGTQSAPMGVGKLSDSSNEKTYVPPAAKFNSQIVIIDDVVSAVVFTKK